MLTRYEHDITTRKFNCKKCVRPKNNNMRLRLHA